VTTMSGGYGEDIADTVDIHCNTIRAVKSIFFGVDLMRRREAAGV
jgi:hypothetical protein